MIYNYNLPVKLYDPRNTKDSDDRVEFGVGDTDCWYLDGYLARVIANSLKKLAGMTHKYPGVEPYNNEDGYEKWIADLYLVASKLEFYAADISSDIYDLVDWSRDDPDKDIEEYLNASPEERARRWPGSEEYSYYTDLAEEAQEKYLKEALEWLAKWWGGLWD